MALDRELLPDVEAILALSSSAVMGSRYLPRGRRYQVRALRHPCISLFSGSRLATSHFCVLR